MMKISIALRRCQHKTKGWLDENLDVSFEWWYPQIIHFYRVFHYFHHPFWGTPIFGNTQIATQVTVLRWDTQRLVGLFLGRPSKNKHTAEATKKPQQILHPEHRPHGQENSETWKPIISLGGPNLSFRGAVTLRYVYIPTIYL